MKVAIIVGHSKKSPGAYNETYDVQEYDFNEMLAKKIKDTYHRLVDVQEPIDIQIVYRTTTYQDLPIQINELNPDLIVSLHCNAFDTKASGCEMLYYYKSVKGKEIAKNFQYFVQACLGNKNRGTKEKSSEDRGGYLLRYTNAPCIIAEPFFLDNDTEYLNAKDKLHNDELAVAYCEAIQKSLESL